MPHAFMVMGEERKKVAMWSSSRRAEEKQSPTSGRAARALRRELTGISSAGDRGE